MFSIIFEKRVIRDVRNKIELRQKKKQKNNPTPILFRPLEAKWLLPNNVCSHVVR